MKNLKKLEFNGNPVKSHFKGILGITSNIEDIKFYIKQNTCNSLNWPVLDSILR